MQNKTFAKENMVMATLYFNKIEKEK